MLVGDNRHHRFELSPFGDICSLLYRLIDVGFAAVRLWGIPGMSYLVLLSVCAAAQQAHPG